MNHGHHLLENGNFLFFNNNGQLKQRLSPNGDDEEGIDDEDGLVQPSVDLQLTADEKPEVQVVDQ